MHSISPYKYNSQWVFDDLNKKLDKEPLRDGTDNILNYILIKKNFFLPSYGIKVTFSSYPFFNYEYELDLLEEHQGGANYKLHGTNLKGRLCPKIFCYFDSLPPYIFFRVDNEDILFKIGRYLKV